MVATVVDGGCSSGCISSGWAGVTVAVADWGYSRWSASSGCRPRLQTPSLLGRAVTNFQQLSLEFSSIVFCPFLISRQFYKKETEMSDQAKLLPVVYFCSSVGVV